MTKTLYDPTFEHDACGVGMVADLTATPSNATILDALTILENLEHRGASGSDVDSGDGAGVLIQMPDAFIRDEFGDVVPPAGEYGIAQWMVPQGTAISALRRSIDDEFSRVGLTSLGAHPIRRPTSNARCTARARSSSTRWISTPLRARPTCSSTRAC